MARPRVEVHRLRELIRLRRLGASGREVAQLLRMSPKTERRYRLVLDQAGLLWGLVGALPSIAEVRVAVDQALPSPEPPRSTVEPWRDVVNALVSKGLSPSAVYDRIRLGAGDLCKRFHGSLSAVQRFVRRLRRERGIEAEQVVIPIASVPGEAQVDFGYAGKLYDPAKGVVRRAWVFVMLLTHSRHFFARLVFDQRTETWLDLHEQAFRAFGGVPSTLVPDNCKRAVLRAAFGVNGTTELERSYREFAESFGFRIDPAPPGQPCKRGKVERTVKYLRSNPLKARDGESIDAVQADLDQWSREVASRRVHGTTKRRPLDVFELEEKCVLLPLPPQAAPRVIWKRARVHPDSHVTVSGRLFSVPWRLVQEPVWVRRCADKVEVFHKDALVATHVDRGRPRMTHDEHLPRDRALLRHRRRTFWEARARTIGPETLALVQAVFDQDPVLSHLRQAQAIIRCLERFPVWRAEGVSRRARGIGDLTYRGIRQALSEGADLLEGAAQEVASRTSTMPSASRSSPTG